MITPVGYAAGFPFVILRRRQFCTGNTITVVLPVIGARS